MPKGEQPFCPSETEMPFGILLGIVKNYMADNPDELGENALLITHRAVAEAFPCEGEVEEEGE